MAKKLLFFFICISVLSCDDAKEAGDTWIGGEIVNPKTNFVVLKKNGMLIDTVKLNTDNTFRYKFDNAEPGLYTFSHNEYQMFLLEPGDSLMFRVNTMSFDESLHYSGNGAKENNFLIDLYLRNEKEANELNRFYTLSPKEFQKKIDSIEKVHQNRLKKFVAKNKPSKEFKKIVEANYDYNRFIKKEMYTLAFHKDTKRAEKEKFPKNFHDYRDEVSLNEKNLGMYYPYTNFLDLYFDNLTYKAIQYNDTPDRFSFTHNFEKIKLMDSLVANDSLKNHLMRRSVRRYLRRAKNAEKERQMLALFKELNSDTGQVSEMESLVEATVRLEPGQKIPNVTLVNTNNVSKNMHEIIKKPTVLYFWSLSSGHYKEIHTKASELAAKYPEYQFIGINTDTHYKKWLKAVNYLGYSAENEYQFDDVQNAEKQLVFGSINKTLVVDKTATIVNSGANLFTSDFEGQLLALLNQ